MNQKIHKVEVKLSIKEISKEIWNELTNEINNPFYEWNWIKNLEISKSVSRETGWQPLYFVAFKNEDKKEITNLLINHIESFAITNKILSCNFLYIDESWGNHLKSCLLYTSPSPRDVSRSRMPSSA